MNAYLLVHQYVDDYGNAKFTIYMMYGNYFHVDVCKLVSWSLNAQVIGSSAS